MIIHDPTVCKIGKRPMKWDEKRLRVAKYVDLKGLPPAPEVCDYTRGITKFGMMLNDRLGCCTIAAAGHGVQIWTANQGVERTVTDDGIELAYELWCGYNPQDPATDQGGYEVDVLNRWRKEGFAGNLLKAYADPDWKNLLEVRQAIYLFEGLYIGVALPVAWQSMVVWDAVDGPAGMAGSWGGHAVYVVGYNSIGPVLVTWGALKQMTWAGWGNYVDEAHALFSPEQLDKNGNSVIPGVDWKALDADLALL